MYPLIRAVHEESLAIYWEVMKTNDEVPLAESGLGVFQRQVRWCVACGGIISFLNLHSQSWETDLALASVSEILRRVVSFCLFIGLLFLYLQVI